MQQVYDLLLFFSRQAMNLPVDYQPLEILKNLFIVSWEYSLSYYDTMPL